MKKTSVSVKKLLIPQYATMHGKGYEIHIVVTDDVDAYIRSKHPTLADDNAGAMHVWQGFESWIVLPNDASISSVVHECWHCVYRIFKQIKADGLDNETVAYTLGWLTEQATDFLYSTPEYQKKAEEFLKKKIDKKKPTRVKSRK